MNSIDALSMHVHTIHVASALQRGCPRRSGRGDGGNGCQQDSGPWMQRVLSGLITPACNGPSKMTTCDEVEATDAGEAKPERERVLLPAVVS